MNKRIKTVWVLSIATMVLILCGQAYWLTNQYKLVTDIHIEQLKTACTEAIEKEQQWRYETMERGDTLENKIRKTYTIKFDCKKTSREVDGKQVSVLRDIHPTRQKDKKDIEGHELGRCHGFAKQIHSVKQAQIRQTLS